MYKSIKKLYLEFSNEERKRLLLLALLVIITGLFQVLGIASIFPFIAVAADPGVIDQNEYLLTVKNYLHVSDNRDFIVLLGGIVFIALVLTNLFLAFSTWVTMRFTAEIKNNLALRLLKSYLNESYLFHLNRNSAELSKNILAEVTRVVNGGILSVINMISNGFTVLCILFFLILVDPVVSLIVGLTLGCSYGLIYLLIRSRLKLTGQVVIQLYSDRVRYIHEALGGIKELKIMGREKKYFDQFRCVSEELVDHDVFHSSAARLPRFLLETVSFGGIVAVAIYLVAVRGDEGVVLPMISLYAFAGYRLMPALQAIYQATATITHDIAAVDLFYDDIKSMGDGVENLFSDLSGDEVGGAGLPMKLYENLEVVDLCFNYPNTNKKAVKDLSLSIGANTSIGIIGTSGSGKSTLVDIILGLLRQQQGRVNVDGVPLTEKNLRAWQANIGYVPQVIFLADSNISANIAFGVADVLIDQCAVEKAAKMANIHAFITDELEQGYETIVGERGVRLSGGQRQRIGIARALYHDPSLLVLDEATSALDSGTEQAVMEAVNSLAHKKTIIMIAHRLSTVKDCDKLIWLENGEVKAEGKYDELISTSASFKDFVKYVKSE